MMPNVRITVFPKDSDPIIESRPNPLYKYITPKLMGEFRDPYKFKGETTEPDPNDKVQTPKFTLPVSLL